jgi:hypothetical protein
MKEYIHHSPNNNFYILIYNFRVPNIILILLVANSVTKLLFQFLMKSKAMISS